MDPSRKDDIFVTVSGLLSYPLLLLSALSWTTDFRIIQGPGRYLKYLY